MELIAGDNKESMQSRGLSFESIINAPFLALEPIHYGNQIIYVCKIDSYAVAVPCKIQENGDLLMVTAFKSRKLTKKYLKQ